MNSGELELSLTAQMGKLFGKVPSHCAGADFFFRIN